MISMQRSRHSVQIAAGALRSVRTEPTTRPATWSRRLPQKLHCVRGSSTGPAVSSAISVVTGRPSLSTTLARSTQPSQMYTRSEEHTSELQSPYDHVCRLLLEKKKVFHILQTNTLKIIQLRITHQNRKRD